MSHPPGFSETAVSASEASTRRAISTAFEAARGRLLAERTAAGHWEGELSSSALSTATAALALLKVDRVAHEGVVRRGLAWLAETQNSDGGWGDTTRSRSNISTTLLCRAAFGLAGEEVRKSHEATLARCEEWIVRAAGGLEPERLAETLAARYGKDRTFSVPILMACAMGGMLGPAPECWDRVPALPFELAALPRGWFAALRLPVVSYALPALIAIGQVRWHHRRGAWPWSAVRAAAVERTRRLLREIQPKGGGFLEATPLTAFVTMALADMGEAGCDVAREGVAFLLRSTRPDGSWPIDTNLATWTTTLSVKGLGGNTFSEEERKTILAWLTGQQYREIHPYTLSAPGGWAWTDLPGGVPDADDTAGALLALRELGEPADSPGAAAGVRWLLGLQNRDGGIPTFCRGWGALPFDRSAPDLTAHALAAMRAWDAHPELAGKLDEPMGRAVAWLERTQKADGSWEPLWFGNEWAEGEANPVYGTAIVLKYLCALPEERFPALGEIRRRAAAFLVSAQRAGGGWSGGADVAEERVSIEETAVALEALTLFDLLEPGGVAEKVIRSGADALLRLTENGTRFEPSPVGLYFARLWYYERLYPVIFATAGLRAVERWLARRE